MDETLAIRVDADNPTHHLWLNGPTWWIHFTVHTADGRKRRVRYSLETPEEDEARMLRDAVFASYGALEEARPGARAPAPRPRIELAEPDSGLPVPIHEPRVKFIPLARVERVDSEGRELCQRFWASIDPHRIADRGIHLWTAMNPWEREERNLRMKPVATARLEDFRDELGRAPARRAAAHLLHAWIARVRETYRGIDLETAAHGGDWWTDEVTRRIVNRARLGRPLTLP